MATHKQQSPKDASYDTEDALRLYEQYGKPLERDHPGEYLAVSPKGQTLLGDDLLTLSKEATKHSGPGNVIFKIGDIAVGEWL